MQNLTFSCIIVVERTLSCLMAPFPSIDQIVCLLWSWLLKISIMLAFFFLYFGTWCDFQDIPHCKMQYCSCVNHLCTWLLVVMTSGITTSPNIIYKLLRDKLCDKSCICKRCFVRAYKPFRWKRGSFKWRNIQHAYCKFFWSIFG